MSNPLDNDSRANNLRIRLYAAKRTIKWAAGRLGVSREWLSKVLNEAEESESLLDKLEDLLKNKDELVLAA